MSAPLGGLPIGARPLAGTEDAGAGGDTISDAGGIASAEAFGTPSALSNSVEIQGAGGIATGEGFQNDNLVTDLSSTFPIVNAGNIATAEVFGSPAFAVTLAPSSIASAEAFSNDAMVYELFTYLAPSRLTK